VECLQANLEVLRPKNLHKCLPLTVQEIQKVLPKEGSSMTCKLISIADIPHDSLIDQPTNL
jgi:hypothetical protein